MAARQGVGLGAGDGGGLVLPREQSRDELHGTGHVAAPRGGRGSRLADLVGPAGQRDRRRTADSGQAMSHRAAGVVSVLVCTTVVSIDPHSDVPVLLLGVRDEFSDRPWLPPDRHWPEYPELFGGRDLQAGGTWLAV